MIFVLLFICVSYFKKVEMHSDFVNQNTPIRKYINQLINNTNDNVLLLNEEIHDSRISLSSNKEVLEESINDLYESTGQKVCKDKEYSNVDTNDINNIIVHNLGDYP